MSALWLANSSGFTSRCNGRQLPSLKPGILWFARIDMVFATAFGLKYLGVGQAPVGRDGSVFSR